jgi:hypothetical protein
MSESFLPARLTTEEGIRAVICAQELSSWRREFAKSGKNVDLTANAEEVARIKIETLLEEFGSLVAAIKKSSSFREELVAFESGDAESAI